MPHLSPPPPAATPPPIRTVIVDDEPAARRGVRLLLERDAEIRIVGEAGNGAEAAELIRRERPALAFLDVQMPGSDGFGALAQCDPAHLPRVVFVTAYDEYALRAFEVHAVDYLLKPFEDARFDLAVRRAKEALRRPERDATDQRLRQLLDFVAAHGRTPEPAAGPGADRIVLKSSGEIFFLKLDEIDWI